MRLLLIVGCLAAVIGCLVAPVMGQQQVKLQSGTTLIGNVTLDGANLVVDVDGAKIAVPFKDVASVTPATVDEAKRAQQLLVRGLESQILSDREDENQSLLAEAYRLAPEDPQIAFWYARSLVNSGYGQAAHDVFEPRQEAIVVAYPGVGNRLADQINERLALEELPAPLVKRLDAIAAAVDRGGGAPSETTQFAAYFQLVDQADEPIDRSAFRVDCNGESENLESYADGYYLYTFSRRQGYGSNPCRLVITKPELIGDGVEFNGGTRGAENVGVIRVKRLSDTDRRPVVVKVIDPAGKPLASATVTFNAIGRSGGQEAGPPMTTTAEGTAKLKLFPNDYICQVSLKDYSPSSQKVVVPADEKQAVTVDVTLYRAISAAIKVEWRSKMAVQPGMPQFPNDAVTMGTFDQHIGPDGAGGFVAGQFGPPWVRLVQDGDAVRLQFTEQMNFPQAGMSWVGRWKGAADDAKRHGENTEDDAEVFDMLDLAQLDDIKNQMELERTNFGGMPGRVAPVSLPVEVGDIYLGRLSSRDPQTGRPAMLEFKILATELKRP